MISQRSSRWRRCGARAGAVAFGICALLALAAPGGALAAPTGSIAGTVTDAGSHGGIEGVEVCAYLFGEAEAGEPSFKCEFTGPTGAYLIDELAEGEYEVEFWPGEQTYFGQYYEGAVTVEAGPVAGIDAELVAAAGIRGTVTAAGEPVEEEEVCARLLPSGTTGRCTWTQPDGSYGLWRLTPGSYKVEFRSVGGLAPQYYDQKAHWGEATVVAASVGTSQPGIDAALQLGGEIRGSVFSTGGTPLPEILVCAIETVADELEYCDETGIFGQYSLGPVANGPYKVGFSIEYREFLDGEFLGEKDGFQTRFYSEQTTLAAANPIGLTAPAVVSGVNAHLVSSSASTAPLSPPPPVLPKQVRKKKRLHCRPGFRKKRVKGKQRCVRVHRHHRHHHHGLAREWRPLPRVG